MIGRAERPLLDGPTIVDSSAHKLNYEVTLSNLMGAA